MLPTTEFRQAIRRTILPPIPKAPLRGRRHPARIDSRNGPPGRHRQSAAGRHASSRQGSRCCTRRQFSTVIPAKGMQLIEKSLGDGEEEVHLALHANDVTVWCGKTVISCQLVQGRFPEYRKVIPTSPRTTIDLPVGPFYSAVRQAQIVTNEESRGVDFTFTKGTLRLSSKATDIGQSKIELPISYDGDDVTITFDPRFVADFLRGPRSRRPSSIPHHRSRQRARCWPAEDRYLHHAVVA
ncbi:MAG: DNA polymerase III subunit beta [Planctomycetaceae bacterium]